MSSHMISFHPLKSAKRPCEPVVVVLPLSTPLCIRPETSFSFHFNTAIVLDRMLIVVADYSTSVRLFEALREKTENKTQYDAYVNELKPVREELGIILMSPLNVLMIRDSAEGGDVAGC
jgi:hypothetical protein